MKKQTQKILLLTFFCLSQLVQSQIKTIPVTGTTQTNPLIGPIEFRPNSGTNKTALVDTSGGVFYIGSCDSKDASNSTQGSIIELNFSHDLNAYVFDTHGNNGKLTLSTTKSSFIQTDSTNLTEVNLFNDGSSLINSTFSNYAGFQYFSDYSTHFKKHTLIDSLWGANNYISLFDTTKFLWRRTDSSSLLTNPAGFRVMEIFNNGNIDAGSNWSVSGSISMGSNNGFDSLLLHNTVYGYQCLGGGGQQPGYPKTLTTGDRNTLIGALCGFHISSGRFNTVVGDEAGEFMDSLQSCVAIGYHSQNGNKAGNYNTSVGAGALQGAYRVIGGQLEACNTFPNQSTAVGYNAIATDTMTDANDAFGYLSLQEIQSGNTNAAFGQNTLGRIEGGDNNTAIGGSAGALIQGSPNGNTLIGALAGYGDNTNTHSHNTVIGASAGQSLTNGSDNVIIGYQSNATIWGNLNSTLWIDEGNNSTPLIYGNFSNGRIGLGTISPDTRLHIVGNLKQVDGSQGIGKVLTSDANGVATWSTVPTSSTTPTQTVTLTGDIIGTGTDTVSTTSTNSITINGTTQSIHGNPTFSITSGTTQTITLTGDVIGTGTASIASTLATVNSNVGSFGSASTTNSITVNAKGLTTGVSTVAIQIPESAVTNLTSDLSAKAPINNPTFTGNVTLAQDAASNLQAVTLQQLNNAIAGTDYKLACKYVTVGTLPTYIYNNGSSGVGATITGVSVGALSIDGVTPSVGDRILVTLETGGNAPYNGSYVVTTVGSGVAVYVLTRSTDFNQSAEIDAGDAFFITAGNTKASSTYVYNGITSPTVGATNLTFTQTQGAGVYSAGYGTNLITNVFSADTTSSSALVSKLLLTSQLAGKAGTSATFTVNGTSMALGTSSTVTSAAGTLTGIALNSSVVTSSLTAVGTVTTGTINCRIAPTYTTIVSSPTITINTDAYSAYGVMSLSTAATFTTPTGTPVPYQPLIIRVKDNGTARTLSFTTGTNGFRFSSDAPAPTTTTISKTMYLGFRWNEVDSKWDNISPVIGNF